VHPTITNRSLDKAQSLQFFGENFNSKTSQEPRQLKIGASSCVTFMQKIPLIEILSNISKVDES